MTTRGLSIVTTITGGEPVSLDEFKDFASIDFDDRNEMLGEMLVSAREEVEQYTGLSLIQKTITARWEELTTAELPYGPVTAIEDQEDYTIEGLLGSFPNLKADSEVPVTITYTAGYTDVPKGLKDAIKICASEMFAHRGEGPKSWKKVAAKYSRKGWTA